MVHTLCSGGLVVNTTWQKVISRVMVSYGGGLNWWVVDKNSSVCAIPKQI